MRQQLETGIIEPVSKPTEFDSTHAPSRSDTSRKAYNESTCCFLSMNECLEKGPNMVPRLFDVLIMFRGFPIGVASEVEKAFQQIEIEPNDRRMLRFLWFDDISKENPEIVHYHFCRLVFGLTPSSAILSSLIDHYLDRRAEEHAEIVSLLKRSFYFDDLVSGSWDDGGNVEVYDKSNRIMEEGGFKLRKWTSNSQAFRKHVAEETLEDFVAVEFRETQLNAF